MELVENKTYRIVYNPRCSVSCETTCISCKVDGYWEYTGRNWVDREGEPLYEFRSKDKFGIFGKTEIKEQ